MPDATTPRRVRRTRAADLRRAGLDSIGEQLGQHIPPPDPPSLGEAMIARARAAPPPIEPASMPRSADVPAEGALWLPRRLPAMVAAGLVASALGWASYFGTYTANVENRFQSLTASDERLTSRSDERYEMLKGRLDAAERERERERERLPKLEERFGRFEEKIGSMFDILREMRQERAPKR